MYNKQMASSVGQPSNLRKAIQTESIAELDQSGQESGNKARLTKWHKILDIH